MKSLKNGMFIITILSILSCAKPMAKFTMNDAEKKAPTSLKFVNESKKADKYLWDFGDGTTSEEFMPEHRYSLSGRYLVSLTAKKGTKQNRTTREILIEAPHECLIEMETNFGIMIIKLYDTTPLHRDNFLKMAETGYLERTLFHRVINGFMIQGGDPESKNAKKGQRLGTGGPSYTIPAEFVDTLVHIKGALAGARQGDAVNPEKRSSGSQFYIVQGKPVSEQQIDILEAQKGIQYTKKDRDILINQGGTPFLDKEYTVFGQVVKGFDVIDKIAATQTDSGDRPVEDISIIKVRVIK